MQPYQDHHEMLYQLPQAGEHHNETMAQHMQHAHHAHQGMQQDMLHGTHHTVQPTGPHMPTQMPTQIQNVDPYFTQAIHGLTGQPVVIETVRGTIRGVLCQVMPDHIVLQTKQTHYFIRNEQLIWVMPQRAY